MGISYNTSLVRDGLVLHLDAANKKSYSGTGTAWNDMSGNNNNATLVNSVAHSTANNGSMVFDGVNDYSTIASSTSMNTMTAVTACMWIKFPSIPISGIPFNKEGSLRLYVAESNTNVNYLLY